MGRLEEAVTSCEKAVDINPDLAEARVNLGNVLLNLRRPNEAISHCRKALAIKPNYVDANYALGNALLKTGNFEEGLKHTLKGRGVIEFRDDESQHFQLLMGHAQGEI